MSEMWINMGPQHPMTHGLWNLRVRIDGERILDVDPEMGYLHRGIEKISEDRHYNEVITLMDRTCYVAGLNWEHLYIIASEQALHITPPERAEYIRMLCAEFQRIGSHIMWYAAFVQDIGLMTPFLYAMRDRPPPCADNCASVRVAAALFGRNCASWSRRCASTSSASPIYLSVRRRSMYSSVMRVT